MSIRYIVGNPGSGKSYMGAKVLYDSFIRPKKHNVFSFISASLKAYKNNDKDKTINDILNENSKKDEFLFAYTNINEFKFELNDKIKKLDFEDLKNRLSVLYTEYKHNKESGDKELIELAKELELYKALFVIDEIHNFFDKDNEILQWWLTYHRHLYQELYLITQDLSLVATEYKTIAEFFFKAVDSSKRFFSKKFRYIQYSSYKLYQKDIIKKFHVDFEKEVFDLYHSGNNGLGKSAVKKFMWIALFFAFIVFVLFKILVSMFLTSDEEVNPKNNSKLENNSTRILDSNYSKSNTKKVEILSNPISNSFYYSFDCLRNYCVFKNSSDFYRAEVLFFLISKTEKLYELKHYNGVKGSMTHHYVLKDDVFKPLNITYLNQGKTDEKLSNKELGSFNLGGFGK